MATLTGTKLYNHLENLQTEVLSLRDNYSEGSFSNVIHGFMHQILDAEKNHLESIYPKPESAILSFSGHGLPSVESFSADLESICTKEELTGDFITQDSCIPKEVETYHEAVSENVFMHVLSDNKKKGLTSKIQFGINETNDGRLTLQFVESLYIDSIDELSQKVPFLVKSGTVHYKLEWGTLFEETNVEYFVPKEKRPTMNTNLPAVIDNDYSNGIVLDDIMLSYKFCESHYVRIPDGFLGLAKKLPSKYPSLIIAGHKTRIKYLDNIIKSLSKSLKTEVIVRTKDENPLTVEGKYTSKVLSELELKSEREEFPCKRKDTKTTKLRILTKQQTSYVPVGTIEFVAPFKRYNGQGYYCGLNLDEMNLKINGEIFESPKHYLRTKNRIKRRIFFIN